MTTASWTAVLGQYWACPWIRSDNDVTTAGAEFREVFRTNTPDNNEIIRAVRWLAGPENREQGKCPTLRELIRAVAILRKKEREAQGPLGDGDVCPVCRGQGWVDYRPGWAVTWTERDYQMAYAEVAPCPCQLGSRALDADAKACGLDEMAQAAMRRRGRDAVMQWRARQALGGGQ